MPNVLHNKVVLVLGGSVMQLPLIAEARLQGMKTIVMDQNPYAIGFRLASGGLLTDISDVEAATQEAHHHHQHEQKLDAVLTVGTDFVRTVSSIASQLNLLGGMKKDVAFAVTDKIAMRSRLQRNGFDRPQFVGFEAASTDVDRARSKVVEKGMSLPWVVKPSDSMGSRGVQKVENLDSFGVAWGEALNNSKSGRLIVEEYVPGRELSIDALVWEGEVFVYGVADRIIEHEPYFVETGHVIPSQEPDHVQREACSVFARAVRSLGIVHGAAKGDLRLTTKGVVVGEVAGRLSGGYMSGYTYPYSSGVNLMKALLELTFGQRPSIAKAKAKPKRVAMDVGIVGKAGKVRSIEGVHATRRMQGVVRVDVRVAVGDVVEPPKNNLMKAANILVVGESHEEVLKLAKQVRKTIAIR